MIKIYHNPRCRKSRETLELLQSQSIDPEIILYMKETPTKKDIKALLKLLDIKPQELIRKNEPIYKEKYKDKKMTATQWITAMTTYPQLIERPIVIHGDKAVIARPPERVEEIL